MFSPEDVKEFIERKNKLNEEIVRAYLNIYLCKEKKFRLLRDGILGEMKDKGDKLTGAGLIWQNKTTHTEGKEHLSIIVLSANTHTPNTARLGKSILNLNRRLNKMGIIEFLTGWEYVGNTNQLYFPKKNKNKMIFRIHPNIITLLKRKIDNVMRRKYKSRRGKNVSGCVVHIKGRTFIYRCKEPSHKYIDNQGHGGYISYGKTNIFRKLRRSKK